MNIKEIFQNIFGPKKKSEFILPSEITLTEQDLNCYRDNLTLKSSLPPDVVQRDEGKINNHIAEYMQSEKGQILNSPLKDFSVKAISVDNVAYDFGNLDMSLGFGKNDNTKTYGMRHPAIILKESFLESSEDAKIYAFLKMNTLYALINYTDFTYRKDGIFSFSKMFSRYNPKYKNNREIIFFNENNLDITKMESGEMLYSQPNIFNNSKNNIFKGIIIRNLTLKNEISNILSSIENQFKDLYSDTLDNAERMQKFEKVAWELNKSNNEKIAFITQIEDMIIIQGMDEKEKTIYTTIPDRDLPITLKSFPKANHQSHIHQSQKYTHTQNKSEPTQK